MVKVKPKLHPTSLINSTVNHSPDLKYCIRKKIKAVNPKYKSQD